MSKTGIYRLVQSVRSRIDSPLTHGRELKLRDAIHRGTERRTHL